MQSLPFRVLELPTNNPAAALGIVPMPDSISANALAAPSAPMMQNMVKPRRASTEATRRGAAGLEYRLQGAFELLGQKGRKRRASGLPEVRHIAFYSVLRLTPPDRATDGLDGLKALTTAVPDTQGDAPGPERVLGCVEANRAICAGASSPYIIERLADISMRSWGNETGWNSRRSSARLV